MENENKNDSQVVEPKPVVEEPTAVPITPVSNVSQEVPTQPMEIKTEVSTVPEQVQPAVQPTQPVQAQSAAPTVQTTQPVQAAQPQAQPTVNKQEPQVQVIMQQNDNKQKKKMDKQTLFRIIAASVIVLGIAVYFIFFHKVEKPTDEGDPKSVTTAYFQYLVDGRYREAIKYVYLPEDSYVTEDDYFMFTQSNSNFKDILGNGIKDIRKTSKTETKAVYIVSLNNDRDYTVNLDMLSDGNWRVIVEDLYLENWKVEVPGSSKLYIDGSLVPKSLSKANDKGHDVYTIPAIGPYKKEFKVETSFDELTKKFEVAGSNSGEEIKLELKKEDEINSALAYIKEMWNGMYKDYVDGTPNKDVLVKYFDTNFKEADMKTAFKENFDKLSGIGNKQYTYKDVEMESVIVNPDKKQMIEGNNVIRIEFGYKLNTTVDYIYEGSKDVTKSMTRYSSIKLTKTNDGYRINEITDDKLFNYLKYTVQEY